MKNYDFSVPVDRRGGDSAKWNHFSADDVIPLWVADMDFPAAPAIQDALSRRVAHGVFGYAQVDEGYFDAIVSWQRRRHQWAVDRQWILYTTGVVPAASCAIKALTLPGEKVLVMTPVYNCFFSSIRNQGCGVEESALVRRGDSYIVDWQDFEAKCQDDKVTVFLLCNPHNPVGRVWTREELERMGDICARHHVRVVSDEIHCELMMPGNTFVPFAAVSEQNLLNGVTLCSPSKSFNTAGLQNAYLVCKDDELRRRIDRVINIYEVCDVNPFGIAALKAAYNESGQWLDDLCLYIWNNYLWLRKFLNERLPKVTVCRLDATYLAWLDIRQLGISSDEAIRRLLHDGKVFVSSGTLYGQHDGEGYLRINLACARQTLEEGMRRFAQVLSII